MSSPPWEPQRPPYGPPPGGPQPNPYGPDGRHWNQPTWPGPQWPPGGQPPTYGPPAAPYGGFGAPQPPNRSRSSTGWLIAGAVAAVGLLSVGLFSVLGVGPRDERSFEAGRSAALDGGAGALVKFGGMTPEEFCKNRFTLHTGLNQDRDIRRRDFMAGCLEGVEEELNRRP